jgi:hypothetical protein
MSPQAQLGRAIFVLLVLGVALGLFMALTSAVRQGQLTRLVVLVLLTSPVLWLAVWAIVQGGYPDLPDWRGWSAAATVGDVVFLLTAIWLAATRWGTIGEDSVWRSNWWTVIAFTISLLGGVWFHFVLGGRSDSSSDVLRERLHDAPVSWAHNIGTFPVLLGAVIYTIVPLFFTGHWKMAVFTFLIAVVGWGVCAAADTARAELPISDPSHFNSEWTNQPFDWSRWRVQAAPACD